MKQLIEQLLNEISILELDEKIKALNELKNGKGCLLINYIIDGGEGINKTNFQKIIDFTRGNNIDDEKVYFIFQDFKLKDNLKKMGVNCVLKQYNILENK